MTKLPTAIKFKLFYYVYLWVGYLIDFEGNRRFGLNTEEYCNSFANRNIYLFSPMHKENYKIKFR